MNSKTGREIQPCPPEGADWLILTEGLVLLVAILAGVYVIFLYWQRQAALLKAKRGFISQVTHELKSPLLRCSCTSKPSAGATPPR